MTTKTLSQHVACVLAAANVLDNHSLLDGNELREAATHMEKSQERVFQLENQQAQLETKISALQSNSGFEKVTEAQIRDKANRFEPSKLVLIDWHDIFADFEPHQKEGAFVALQMEHDYTIGDNAGILISVWDVLKIYVNLNGCDHRVLKALSNCSFVVYRA